MSSHLAASSKTNALGRSGRQARCLGLCQGQELQGAQVEQEWKEIAKTFIFSRGSDSDQGGCWLSPSVADYRQPSHVLLKDHKAESPGNGKQCRGH